MTLQEMENINTDKVKRDDGNKSSSVLSHSVL